MYQSLQGNMGLGKAIEYFTSHQIPIAIPLNDTQSYDLIADFNGGLQRIQVKTASFTRTDGKSYSVLLKNCGGNRTGNTRIVLFDNNKCDYLFIYTANNKCYLIPSKEVEVTNSITVGVKYSEYEIFSKTLSDFAKETVH